jgi:hypothetical protein
MASRSNLLRMRDVTDKSCRENQNTFLCSITFSRKSCRLWDNVEKYGTARQATDDNIIRRMRFECWITKVTDIQLKYVTFIAFPWQQWSRERASMLRYTYIAYLAMYPDNHGRVACLWRRASAHFIVLSAPKAILRRWWLQWRMLNWRGLGRKWVCPKEDAMPTFAWSNWAKSTRLESS